LALSACGEAAGSFAELGAQAELLRKGDLDAPVEIEKPEKPEPTKPIRVCDDCTVTPVTPVVDPITVRPPRVPIGPINGDFEPVVGRAAVFSYASGAGATDYFQNSGTQFDWPELTGVNDRQLVGDFMGLGHDQVLFANYDGGERRVLVADYGASSGEPTVLFREDWAESTLLNGWDDDNDLMLTGDFMGVGHDQLMAINRGGSDGLVMILDFKDGPAVRYLERWDSGMGYVGWLDDGEQPMAGDFMDLGYDQVMFFNRDGQFGRVMVQDFKLGAPHRDVRYFESWGDSLLLNGWNDAADRRYVGDFLGLGFDQVLFLNRFPSGGRVMVADFRDGRAPVEPLYWENWSDSPLLNGWHDDDDWAHVGDFMKLGRDQIMFMNRSGEAGRVLVADFGAGAPAKLRYLESWGASALLNGWQDDDDVHLSGHFRAGGGDSLLMFNNALVTPQRAVKMVDTRDALVSTLNSHFTGTITIPSYASIDLTGLSDLPVRSGVRLVGTRYGLDEGALLYTNSLDTPRVFAVRGSDVQISRLRFRGPKHPDTGRSSTLPKVSAIDILQDPVLGIGKNINVSENEMWAWTDATVAVNGKTYVAKQEEVDLGLPRYTKEQAGFVRVERNFLHHNAREGAGYGVVVSKGAYATIVANLFDYNRHAIASDGRPQTGYIAQYNYVLSGGYTVDMNDGFDIPFCASYWNQHFDVHGTGPDGYGQVAGEYFDISFNTVRGEQDYCVTKTRPVFMLRGTPTVGAYFHDNAVVHDDSGEAISKKGGDWANMFIGPNHYDVESSEDISVGDFDGDKRSDVFLATGTAWFYSSGGMTEWRYLNASSVRTQNLAFADLDNDGKTDVISRQTDNRVYYSSAGTGPWLAVMSTSTPIQSLRFYDFNGDGFTDIFRTENSAWWIWDGKTRTESSPGGSSLPLSALRFGEFDGTPGADVIAAVNSQWSYSSGARLPWARLNRQLLSSLASTIVADIDGDTRPDVLYASGGTWMYSKSGQGEWITLKQYGSSPYATLNGVQFGDFDRDGHADALRFELVPKLVPNQAPVYTSGTRFVLSSGASGDLSVWSRHSLR
jgi:hypothetical protein